MKNYLNTVLDFPKTVNEILPKNNFNELVDNSCYCKRWPCSV